MDAVAVALVVLVVVATSALVIGVFIWAAVKDGEEDKALQRRLGIRRKTRLGP
jgi:hypothetical protein